MTGPWPSAPRDSGAELKLPLASSVILATARMFNAMLWTQDKDFDGLPKVKFTPKT